MTLTVRLFAILRERAGISEMSLALPSGSRVSDARDELLRAYPMLADLLPRVAFAVNRSYVPLDCELHDGDEVAAIPPVSGG